MSTIVRVPPKAAEQPTAPASTYDVSQKVRAAFWSGVFVVGLLAVAWWVIIALGALMGNPVPGGWRTWLAGTLACVMAGLAVTCWFGLGWVRAAASRPWRVDDDIRRRAWKQEDAAKKAQEAAAAAAEEGVRSGPLDHDRDPATLNQAQLLHLVALDVLRRHYVHGQKVTRQAMTEEGRCNQPDWNDVNRALCAVGLKKGNTMREDLDFEQAWSIWESGVEIRGREIWVMGGKGNSRFLKNVGEA